MNAVAVIRALGPIDLRNIARDSMLRWLTVLSFAFALIFRWGVPFVAARLREIYGFDLKPYYALIASIVILIAPMLAGVVIGFLLLDQRDDRTLTALQVTPLTLGGYLVYRMGVPVLLSLVVTMAVVPLTGLVRLGPFPLLVVSTVSAPLAPLYALFVASFANNKVQGFALMKALGVVNWPPVIAYFLPTVWQWTVGIVPTYWPVKTFWLLEAGDGGWLGYFLVGLAYQLLLVAGLLRRFHGIMHR